MNGGVTRTQADVRQLAAFGWRPYPSTGIHGRVVHGIGRDIVSGALAPGERLSPESALIARFNGSRTAIREAMKVLVAKGLVEARQRAGTRVRPRADWNLLDPDVLAWLSPDAVDAEVVDHLIELRALVEPTAARLAAERATDEERHVIAAAYERMQQDEADIEAFYAADLVFHLAVFAACHNEFISRLGGVVGSVIEFGFRLQTGMEKIPPGGAAVHAEIVACIRARDGAGAEVAMRAVIERAKRELAQLMEKRAR